MQQLSSPTSPPWALVQLTHWPGSLPSPAVPTHPLPQLANSVTPTPSLHSKCPTLSFSISKPIGGASGGDGGSVELRPRRCAWTQVRLQLQAMKGAAFGGAAACASCCVPGPWGGTGKQRGGSASSPRRQEQRGWWRRQEHRGRRRQRRVAEAQGRKERAYSGLFLV